MHAPWSTKTKSKPAIVCLQVRVSFAISCVNFAKVNSFYVMTYKRNDSLRVSTGPGGIAFELCRVIPTGSEHKNLLLSYHVTRLMAALQDKTMSDDSPSLSFRPAPIDGLS